VPVLVRDLAAEGTDFPLGRQFARRLNQRVFKALPFRDLRVELGYRLG